MARLNSIGLIVLALMLLVIPGMLYNNLNNNGLVVSQSQALTCSADPQTPTCQISGNAGCQSNSAFCNLSGSSISFLNINSPFTSLLSGNIGGLVNGLNTANNGNNQQGPFDIWGGGPFVTADCFVKPLHGSNSIYSSNITACTQITSDNQNMTKATAGITTWTNWNGVAAGVTKTQPLAGLVTNATFWFKCGNGLPASSPQQQFNLNYTATSSTLGYFWFGCDLFDKTVSYPGGCGIGNFATFCFTPNKPVFSLMIAWPISSGATLSSTSAYHQRLFLQVEEWDANHCATASGSGISSAAVQAVKNNFYSPQCIQGQTNWANTLTNTGFQYGVFTPIILFIVGIALLLLGLGLSVGFGGTVVGTGTSFTAGTNEQGTRLAQTLGLGLIVWAPLFSEFSSWFTSGLLPYGFDGTVGIMSIFATGLFFFGLFWRSLSID